jgi:hypothetical protein
MKGRKGFTESSIDSLKWEKSLRNNVDYRLLDHKYEIIFKYKR